MQSEPTKDPKLQSRPLHPGKILLSEFIIPMDICQAELALRLDISQQELDGIVEGKRDIPTDLGVRLDVELGTQAGYWNKLQREFSASQPS
jgi:addiction module HigA family antidote